MFESLSARLQAVIERLRGKAKITEADLDVALREIRLALLEADVDFRVVKEFVARVRLQYRHPNGAGVSPRAWPGPRIRHVRVRHWGGDVHHAWGGPFPAAAR